MANLKNISPNPQRLTGGAKLAVGATVDVAIGALERMHINSGRLQNMDDPADRPVSRNTLFSPRVGYSSFNLPVLGAPVVSGSPAVSKRTTVKQQNQIGRPIFLSAMVGVIAAPGQNGHVYLEVAGPSTASPDDAAFTRVAGVACRNNQNGTTVIAGGPNIANGAPLAAPIPDGGWYRLTSESIANYTEPTYAYVGQATFIAL